MNHGGGRAAGDEPGTFKPRVDLAHLLVKATTFARQWHDQDGCSRVVLDELADAVEGYVATRTGGGVHPDAVIIDDPIKQVPASCDAHRLDEVCPDCAPMIAEAMNTARVYVRPATDAEQRAALDRGFVQVSKADLVDLPDFRLQRAHVEVLIDGTSRGSVLVTNRSTIELEVMQADGTSVGLPPTARGMVPTGASIRTPPREHDELTLGVTDRELRWAQRQAFERVHTGQGADYLWITRLQDGRGLFLTGWSMGGVQLSIGRFGDLEWNDGWCYHPGHTDDGWRAVLGWDGRGEPKGWTRHPRTGRVRPDGTPSSEAVER